MQFLVQLTQDENVGLGGDAVYGVHISHTRAEASMQSGSRSGVLKTLLISGTCIKFVSKGSGNNQI